MPLTTDGYFNPQGSREPRRFVQYDAVSSNIFQSTRLSRASTRWCHDWRKSWCISIHKALASLDITYDIGQPTVSAFQSTRLSRASTEKAEHQTYETTDFNPQGSREPRRGTVQLLFNTGEFQSTRLSRASTEQRRASQHFTCISIHKALASLDLRSKTFSNSLNYFNPQGSREPRRNHIDLMGCLVNFNPQGSREPRRRSSCICLQHGYFNPQGSREPRRWKNCSFSFGIKISIHKALASLDGKNAQLFLHLCHIYMLHIIHLLQIVYQVEISSRNLIVFSGQL